MTARFVEDVIDVRAVVFVGVNVLVVEVLVVEVVLVWRVPS